MTDGNLPVLRRAIDAFNRRDAETLSELSAPDVVFESALVGARVYIGHEGLRTYFRDLDDAWGDWHTADDELIEVGSDRVLQLYRGVGTGRGSGVRIDRDLAVLWTIRDGRISHGKAFMDPAEARAIAGLEAPA
jgi:ketosteroid isomerase-like protein